MMAYSHDRLDQPRCPRSVAFHQGSFYVRFAEDTYRATEALMSYEHCEVPEVVKRMLDYYEQFPIVDEATGISWIIPHNGRQYGFKDQTMYIRTARQDDLTDDS